MASLATIYTTNSPTMGNTYQVTNKEVDELLLDIHTQRGTICSISQTVFKDAVNTVDDQTYEREYIQRWFDEGHNTSPSSGIELNDKTLTANVEKQAQVEAIEALRPLIKSFLEDRKKLSRLEDFLEAKEKKEKEAEEERKRKEAEAVEEERKRKEEEINRQKKEAEDQRQKDLQVKYLYDVQVYKRSLGLA